jgi:hypothetical protein
MTAAKPTISKANCLAGGRWPRRCRFNSSIADELKPYAFSVMVLSLSARRSAKDRAENMHFIAYKIEMAGGAAL